MARQLRSPFDRTQGLGSAREGVGHWWMQRVTALALIPLTLWFAASLIARARSEQHGYRLSRETLRKWMIEEGVWGVMSILRLHPLSGQS